MILVDTAPLVALFDPRDRDHGRCRKTLAGLRTPLVTTVPVLTEAFHLLRPESRGSDALREFVRKSGISVQFLNEPMIARAFELMEKYRDRPMDFADASLVVTAEAVRTTLIFTLDRGDFLVYRVRIGRCLKRFTLVGEK